MLDGIMVTFLQIISYHIKTEPYSAWVTMSFLVLASHVTHLNKCVTYITMKHTDVFLQRCHRVTSPELDDIQWNETATSDSMIVTLLFLLLLKKKLYTFHSHSKCVMISERAKREKETEKEREVG